MLDLWRVDAKQPDALSTAVERVTVYNVGAWTIDDHDRRRTAAPGLPSTFRPLSPTLLLRAIEEGHFELEADDELCVRRVLETIAFRAIECLDLLDGDPDIENGTDVEDRGFSPLGRMIADGWGVGCPISDPGEDEHDREGVFFG